MFCCCRQINNVTLYLKNKCFTSQKHSLVSIFVCIFAGGGGSIIYYVVGN
jgi:hypothetical protein